MATPLVVPTIDISRFHTNPKTKAQQDESDEVVNQIRAACLDSGFFSLVGHGIPRELQDRVVAAGKALFALPLEEKVKVIHPSQNNRGYERIGGQTLQKDKKPDLKEGFYMGKHFEWDHPNVKEHPRLMGPNIFPGRDVMAYEDFEGPTTEYYDAVLALSLRVFQVLAKTMEFGDDVFDDFVKGDPVCILRLLHYPPQPRGDLDQLGCGAHTDFGAITLLYTDSPGLEVLNPHVTDREDWVPVPPNRDAYVVNIGDMMQYWTEGRYRSNKHRVLNYGLEDRYSIPFFFDGNADCPLTPFGKTAAPGEKVETASEHLLRRLDETYGVVNGKK